tara:strand:- start:1211 stop:1429 length:219 start_codon:yes stop_codon:yes gene_type:complete
MKTPEELARKIVETHAKDVADGVIGKVDCYAFLECVSMELKDAKYDRKYRMLVIDQLAPLMRERGFLDEEVA